MNPFLRWRCPIVQALTIFTLLFFAPKARAQSITIDQPESLARISHDGQQVPKRSAAQTPEGINAQDCWVHQRVRLPLRISDVSPDGKVEVWASLSGQSCLEQTNRQGSSQTCWQLAPDVPLQPQIDVDIPVRAILAGAPPFSPASPDSDVTICDKIDWTPISVHVLYFAPDNLQTPLLSAKVDIEADTIGPAAPASISTEPGAGHVRISWSTDERSEAERLETLIFCEPAASSPDTCEGPNVREGYVPGPLALQLLGACARVAGSQGVMADVSQTGAGEPLDPGTRYVFAVAHVDAFGNIGPLSSVACDPPAPPGAAGDDAGGCSAHGRSVSGTTALLAALGLLTLGARRRSSKRDAA